MTVSAVPTVIPVAAAAGGYDVVVGYGVTSRVATAVVGARRVCVVRPDELTQLAGPVVEALCDAGVEVHEVTLPPGESAKSVSTLATLWDDFGAARITRSDAIVAVGGGATTDVAGFAAATWMRGVRIVHVPTTLLAMVDAAVGGKTGINTVHGKNLAGSFHPPAAVVVDLDLLATLPPAEWVNGMAEVVKAGFVDDPAILALVEDAPEDCARPDGRHTRELVERAIRMKARIVSEDLRESGLREVLNYGHTLGHAIERVADYALPHGHAVSIGMVFAAVLASRCGRLDEATAERHRTVLTSVGLPTSYDADAWPQLLDAMGHDKKARGDRLRFVVLDGLARPGILEGPDVSVLADAFKEVSR